MGLLNYFISSSRKGNTAAVAKERLQIIVAHERTYRNAPHYLPLLQKELLEVVAKYVKVQQDHVKVNVEREGNYEVLELNITLPDGDVPNTSDKRIRRGPSP
jgi:cell division topological specificity factor